MSILVVVTDVYPAYDFCRHHLHHHHDHRIRSVLSSATVDGQIPHTQNLESTICRRVKGYVRERRTLSIHGRTWSKACGGLAGTGAAAGLRAGGL